MKRIKSMVIIILAVLSLIAPTTAPMIGTVAVAEAATIALNTKAITLEIGKTKTLTVSGTTKTATWSSSKKSVAAVSSKGIVTAIKTGTATITASVSGKKLTCKVTVVEPITISSTSILLEAGESDTLKVNGTTKTPTWTSSNPSIAKVSSKGKVTAVTGGAITVTATVDGKKLTSNVTVIPLTKISSSSLSMVAGTTETLSIGGGETSLWYSDNKAVALVSTEGVVTAVSAGTATISGYYNGKRFTCVVTVTLPENITEKGYAQKIGDQVQLTVDGIMEGVTYSSGNPLVASVSDTGIVTGLTVGSTTITATLGENIDTYLVTVYDPANPYIKNAPFTAKEYIFNKLAFVAPADWYVESERYSPAEIEYYLTPSIYSSSSIYISIYKSSEYAPRYNETKKELQNLITEKYIRNELNSILNEYGLSCRLSKFTQIDYLADFGRAFKTKYTVTVDASQLKQVIYQFYINKYMVEITVSDAGDTDDIQEVAEYIVNSFILK